MTSEFKNPTVLRSSLSTRIGLIVGLSVLILNSFVPVFAQRRNSKPKPATIVVFFNQPFDLNATKLPAGFEGNDPLGLMKAFLGLLEKRKKDEFETTAAHEQRVQELNSRSILGSLNVDSSFAFVLPADALDTLYDADNEVLRVRLKFNDGDERLCDVESGTLSEWRCRTLRVTTFNETVSRYEGRNEFGATATISRLERDDLRLGFSNDQTLKVQSTWEGGYYEARLKKSPAIAKKIKSDVRAVVIGKLLSPYYRYAGQEHIKPSVTKPIEVITRQHRFLMRMEEIWFFDYENGEVYARIHTVIAQ